MKRRWLSFYALLVYSFLYLPIVVLVTLSFTKDERGTSWKGFTLDWYDKLRQDD